MDYWVRELGLAPAGILLGKLQRGRGAGWLHAMQVDREEARSALLQCITHDPRLDKQVEERSGCYAALAVTLELSVEPIAAALMDESLADDFNERCDRSWLMIDVLYEMGRRGRRDVSPGLRIYAERGVTWREAAEALIELGDPLSGFGDAIAARFPTDDAMDDALDGVSREHRDAWRALHPRIAAHLERRDCKPARGPWVELPSLSTEELLQRSDGQRELARRTSSEDQRVLVEAIERGERAGYAASALIRQGDPGVIEDLWPIVVHGAESGRRHARRVVMRLAGREHMPRAYAWAHDPDEFIAYAGKHILCVHGEERDIPTIRAILAAAWDEGDIYTACSAVDALARLHDQVSVEMLERVCREAVYSYLRRRAADALHTIDPRRFLDEFATECLWDCESATRELACETAPLTAAVDARLMEIRADPWEDEATRLAAAARLRASRQ